MKQITHLVFGGNALKSLNLCGVLRYIYCYNLDIHIRNISGTSMGSFFALAFALKIPIEKLEEIIINSVNDDNNTKITQNALTNFINYYGFNDSHNYLKYIKLYLKDIYDLDDISFMELSKKTGVNLYVSCTKVSDGSNIIFNINNYPDVSVFDAVAASMCIPILSKPVLINDNYYIDGFFSNNLPFNVFNDINKKNLLVIAIYINDLITIDKSDKEMSLIEYYFNIFNIFYRNTDILCNHNIILSDKDHLVITSSPLKSSMFTPNFEDDNINFKIDEKIINDLFLQGFKVIQDYMNNYSNNNVDLALGDIS